MNTKPVRVLLVDDSLVEIETLSRILSSDPNLEVVAKIRDPTKVIEQIKVLKPDIACIDYFMPNISGLELTKKIMAECPLPILIISGKLPSRECREIFDVLAAGALDFVPKPRSILTDSEDARKLIERIRVLSKVYVMKKWRQPPLESKPVSTLLEIPVISPYRVIVIGASTGGPTALSMVLGRLPNNFPIPIVCVQHISKGFLEGFVDWIGLHCSLKVKIINHKEEMLPGHVYLPAEDMHLEFNTHNQMLLSKAPPVQQHRPAIDVTMTSAARCFGKKVIAVLLTGMGNDGAQGMLKVHQAGGVTIAQSEASSVVFGMPKEAIDLRAVKYILHLEEIGPFLIRVLERSR